MTVFSSSWGAHSEDVESHGDIDKSMYSLNDMYLLPDTVRFPSFIFKRFDLGHQSPL